MKRGVGILFLFSLVAIFSIALISASFLDNFLGKITGNPISNSLKGDINQDGVIDKIDLDILVDVAFRGGSFPEGSCLECADINEDGVTDILDVSMMTNYVYRGGAFSTNSLTYICGDTNGDSVLDQTDLDAITSYAFGGVEIPSGAKVDLNGDEAVDILDVNIMTDHVKRNGPAPTCTQTACTNDCVAVGLIMCYEDSKLLKTCGNYDADSCLEWSAGTTCPYGCNVNGCNVSPGNQTSCTDSDGGVNVKVKGYRYGFYSYGAFYNHSDACWIAQDPSILNEVLCDGVTPITIDYFCPNGCSNGVCLSPSSNSTKFCSDSDGINYYNKGYVIDERTNYTDLCLDQGTGNDRVLEYSCSGISSSTKIYSCPNGCVGGACVQDNTTTTIGLCGDADLNSEINAIDITTLSDYAFGGVEIPLGLNVDLNGDGVVDILDVTILTNYVKRGGPKPTCEKESVKVFSGTSWLHNSYNDSMTCQELCGKSDSEVVVNGCYDRNLEKCTVAVGTICMSGESKIILHRTTKNCSDDSLIVDKDGKTEQIFPVGGGTGYWNYKCESRKQEHCYDDGSFDTYYDEVCEYSSDEYLFNDGGLDYEVGKDYATACCCKGNNFNGCTSTDGVNPFIKGKTTSKEGVVYEDKCDGMKVIDYFCDAWGQVTNINDVVCLDGCNDGACKKVEVTPNPETGPIELPDSIYDEEGVSYDCSGCVEEKKCYPFGYRKNGYYCSDENYLFIRQKTGSTEDCVPGAENECQDELFCENNFECKTNVCANGQCITQGFLKKILDWFGRMFGG